MLSHYLSISPWQFGSPWGLPELIQRYISPNKSITWNSINLCVILLGCLLAVFSQSLLTDEKCFVFLVIKLCIIVVFLETVPSSQLKDKGYFMMGIFYWYRLAPKNWCFWIVVLEKTLESPLDCKEIQPVHSKGDQPWDFFGAEAETPVLWPPHAKSWLIGKDSDAGRLWGQEEKGTTEDEMAGWHHWLDGCESEWTPGVGDGQGGLACCDSWGRKESDMTERLNWTELKKGREYLLYWDY